MGNKTHQLRQEKSMLTDLGSNALNFEGLDTNCINIKTAYEFDAQAAEEAADEEAEVAACKLCSTLKAHLPTVSTSALMGILSEDPEALKVIMKELAYEADCICEALQKHAPGISPSLFLDAISVDAESLATLRAELGL